jgi:hypothetical protein
MLTNSPTFTYSLLLRTGEFWVYHSGVIEDPALLKRDLTSYPGRPELLHIQIHIHIRIFLHIHIYTHIHIHIYIHIHIQNNIVTY